MTRQTGTYARSNNLVLANRLLLELREGIDYRTAEPLDAHDKLSAAAQLAEVASELLHQQVEDFRDLQTTRRTWQEVATVLDVSRQAAQQRFGPKR